MNSSLFIGATGLKGLAEGMNVITNNIANVSTVGFKQQDMQFAELMSTQQANMGNWWGAQDSSYVAMGQTGKGLQVNEVRTLFQQGSYESSNTVTDMSITGKGFFEVITPDGDVRYTRAGDFRFDKDGNLLLPDGAQLTGYTYNANTGQRSEGVVPIKVEPGLVQKPKATSAITLGVNLGTLDDKSSGGDTDPYFGLISKWQAGQNPGLQSNQYAYGQGMKVYDAQGTAHTLNFYADGAPSNQSGMTVVEFMLGEQGATAANGTLTADTPLMAGTLTFNSSGQLVDMSAFVPTNTSTPNDLSTWKAATLQGGVPTFTLNGKSVSFDLGVHAKNGWTNVPASAADVGTDMKNLPSMGGVNGTTRTAAASTSYGGASKQNNFAQNGYAEGHMSNLTITTDGKGIASFSNGQSATLFEIPLCRFTSEYNLRREGGNYFSWCAEAGQMERGAPGTSNYGTVTAYSLETSNVDMAEEMVQMIVTQRGFQSNSKVITTADTMLQRAIELKR